MDTASHDDHDDHSGDDHAGDERVEQAVRRLEELDGTDVSAHAGVYDDIQRSLAAVLVGAARSPSEQ
jgi:hypothetical protein